MDEAEFQVRRRELVAVQHREAEKIRQRLESAELETEGDEESATTDAVDDSSPQVF